MQANITLNSGQQQKMGGFLGINRTKIKQLSSKQLKDLVQSDALELIYAHLASLQNLSNLIKKTAH